MPKPTNRIGHFTFEVDKKYILEAQESAVKNATYMRDSIHGLQEQKKIAQEIWKGKAGEAYDAKQGENIKEFEKGQNEYAKLGEALGKAAEDTDALIKQKNKYVDEIFIESA